ncbi:MAG: FMN-binding negative transcriptional regulator [Thermoplasmatales archaeon]|nr:FMN-binding negative transcriptional regulator [Thermoplasmatales archaeon]
MYNPKSFKVTDREKIVEFVRKNSLGLLISYSDEEFYTSHIPFLVNNECTILTGHLAKANPQWRNLDKKKALIIFQSINHYISPTWYNEKGAVPTWNYISIRVSGNAKIISDESKIMKIVDDLSDFFEPMYGGKWKADWEDKQTSDMLKSIVGLQIEVMEVEGKWKLSQNHQTANKEALIRSLLNLGDHSAKEMADEMQNLIDKSDRAS